MTSLSNMGSAKIGESLCDTVCGASRRAQHVCLPDPHYCPTGRFERTLVFSITRHIALHLSHPICGVVASAELREAAFQIAAMPEVAVAENNDSLPAEHDIGTARQSSHVKTITKASTPQLAA